MTGAVGPPIRDAASVVLLRDGTSGLETWLLTRARAMVFAAGMSVFPGGRVEPEDSQLPGVAAVAREIARRFDCAESLASALVGAAIRETFEESGLLLSVPPVEAMQERADVESGRLSFRTLLDAHGVRVDGARLRPWARWITPKGEVRRYDTRFFVACVPEGAVPVAATSESSAATWLNVDRGLEEYQDGTRAMLPPTVAVLRAVAECETVADVLRAAETRDLRPVRPQLVRETDETWAVLPDGTRLLLPRSAG